MARYSTRRSEGGSSSYLGVQQWLVLITTMVLVPFCSYSQYSDSVVSVNCRITSISGGTNINSISNSNYYSGQLTFTDEHSWGWEFDSLSNYVFMYHSNHCDVYYDTINASDSTVCMNYLNGSLISLYSTVNVHDNLSRVIFSLNYNSPFLNRIRIQYDNLGNIFLRANEYFDGTQWLNSISHYQYFLTSGKLATDVYLYQPTLDSLKMYKYYYDSNDTLITEEGYKKYPSHLVSMFWRISQRSDEAGFWHHGTQD